MDAGTCVVEKLIASGTCPDQLIEAGTCEVLKLIESGTYHAEQLIEAGTCEVEKLIKAGPWKLIVAENRDVE